MFVWIWYRSAQNGWTASYPNDAPSFGRFHPKRPVRVVNLSMAHIQDLDFRHRLVAQ